MINRYLVHNMARKFVAVSLAVPFAYVKIARVRIYDMEPIK